MDNEKKTVAGALKEPRNNSAYGGCRYRLAYDKYDEPFGNETVGARSSRGTRILIAAALFVLFFALGFFSYRYYLTSVRKSEATGAESYKAIVNLQPAGAVPRETGRPTQEPTLFP